MSDPITEGLAADAVASEAANARRGHGRSRFSHGADGECSNCGTPLKGQICHSCGQDSDVLQRPFWNHLFEILDGLVGLDGKLWRTVPALMFRPGYVTRQYLSGVRARYVQPFRLYIVVSFAFFLLLWGSGNNVDNLFQAETLDLTPEQIATIETRLAEAEAESPEQAERLRQILAQVEAAAGSDAASDEATADESTGTAAGAADGGDEAADLSIEQALSFPGMREEMKAGVRRYLLPEEADAPAQPGDEELVVGDPGDMQMTIELTGLQRLPYAVRVQLVHRLEIIIDDPGRWIAAMRDMVPRLLFVLLPVYAAVIAIGQIWRRGFYYYDHLIVSLHFHTFLFLLLMALYILAPLIAGWGALIFLVWSNYYLYRLHRTIYEHGRFMSVLRTITLDFTYLVVLTLAFLVLMFVGFLVA